MKMLRKITALFLVIALCLVSLPTKSFALAEKETQETTIIETSNRVVAQKEVDGCTIRYEYLKKSEESFLSIGEERYKLNLQAMEDTIFVSIAYEGENIYETKVVAQAVGTATVAVGLFTVAVVYAAKDIIIAGISATIDLANRAIEVSADAIATTINKVRAGRIKQSNVQVKSSTQRKAAVKAITTIKTAKKSNKNYYFAASLKNGTVYISYEIPYSKAVKRLCSGYDVFASSAKAADAVCKAASPRNRAVPHYAHIAQEGYYLHFHPAGLKWKQNPRYEPHCWYLI